MARKRTDQSKSAWLEQALNDCERGIRKNETRRRKVSVVENKGISEAELIKAVKERNWQLAQIGDTYLFTPANYTIRPIA